MSKILLVEDNTDAVKRIIRYINKIFAELDVVSFPEAGDALQYAKANDISLFILDIQLEDYKGTNLAKQLRELPEYKYTPIIFETALAGEELSAYSNIGFPVRFPLCSNREWNNGAADIGRRLRQSIDSLRTPDTNHLPLELREDVLLQIPFTGIVAVDCPDQAYRQRLVHIIGVYGFCLHKRGVLRHDRINAPKMLLHHSVALRDRKSVFHVLYNFLSFVQMCCAAA